MKICTDKEIEDIYFNLLEKVKEGHNLTTACKVCGYSYTIMNSYKMALHKIELRAIVAGRNKIKKAKASKEYVIPQKSPYRAICYPILRENNYLV